MGTVQEFRTQVWNTPSNNAWTSVQSSSAWPINSQSVPIKPSQKTKNAQSGNPPSNPVPTTASPTFQWSNSWEPVAVVPVNQKKKNSTNNLPSTSPVPSSNPVVLKKSDEVTNPIAIQNQQLNLPQVLLQQNVPITARIDTDATSSDDDDMVDDPLNPGTKRKKTPEEKQMIEEELSKQNLYKTELCRSFCETGSCRYGHKCQFAHGEHEVRPVMRHPKYKTEICKTFSNTGNCPYGNRCRFIHPGVNWNSNWPDDMIVPPELLAAVDQMNISSQQFQQMPFPMQSSSGPVPNSTSPVSGSQFTKITDVKNLVDENDNEAESKPRLAFFQNLTVL